MNIEDIESPLSLAKAGVRRITDFDVQSLVRIEDLGEKGSFRDAVKPAERLRVLFTLLPLEGLGEFPESDLTNIVQQSNSIYQLFQQIFQSDPEGGDVGARRQTLIQKLTDLYQKVFKVLFPYISYSVARTVDWSRLSSDGRAAIQSIKDERDALISELKATSESAEATLEEVRKAAAEQGVSQEAYHFSQEAELHQKEAEKRRIATLRWAGLLGVFAVLTLFLHKIPVISPSNAIESLQLIVSKVLIFGVVAYMLAMSVRSYLSHKHNEIVSRHRQNALKTYRSLVEAGGTHEARDIILQQAASAIYQLQDTGYVRAKETSSNTVTELIPRTSLSPNHLSSSP